MITFDSIKKKADVIIIIALLMFFGISSFTKRTPKQEDPRKRTMEVLLVTQVCVGGDETECITFPKPTLVKINVIRDEKDDNHASIIVLEPKR